MGRTCVNARFANVGFVIEFVGFKFIRFEFVGFQRLVGKQEAELKGLLVERVIQEFLKSGRQLFVFRHEDGATAGVPDMSVTSVGMTSWWEVKHAIPSIEGREVQQLTARKLHVRSSCCMYVVYREKHGVKTTLIVDPRQIGKLDETPDERTATGFDHAFVARFIWQVHDDFVREKRLYRCTRD